MPITTPDSAQRLLTTNGDLLTVIGGVLSRLGISGADGDVLTRQSGLPAWATPSGGGFTPQIAIFRRVTSDQTGISGSYVTDGLEYNSEVLDEGNNWTFSGDVYTCTNGGKFLFIQHNRAAAGVNYFDIEVEGVLQQQLHYFNVNFPVHVFYAKLNANDDLRFIAQTLSSYTLESNASGNGMNQVIAIRLAES